MHFTPQVTPAFAACLQPLNAAPYCVSWSFARWKREGSNGPWVEWADQNVRDSQKEDRYFHDLRSTALASRVRARSLTRTLLKAKRADFFPHIRLLVSALCVDAPTLYVYDCIAGATKPAPWFTLRAAYDAGDGESEVVETDFVSRAGLPAYIQALTQVQAALGDFLQRHADELVAIANREHQQAVNARLAKKNAKKSKKARKRLIAAMERS